MLIYVFNVLLAKISGPKNKNKITKINDIIPLICSFNIYTLLYYKVYNITYTCQGRIQDFKLGGHT